MVLGLSGIVAGLCLLIALRTATKRMAKMRRELRAATLEAEAHRDDDAALRSFELEMLRALEQAQTEREVLGILRAALGRLDPDRPVEVHIVDRDEPILRLVLTSDDVLERATVTASPWDSMAARIGQTLVYETTERLDTCPHLQSRVNEPCSAVCVPLTVMGRILGVLYATGPVGVMPSPAAIASLELVARTTAAHIAVVRAFGHDEQSRIDTLTGLRERRSALDTIRLLLAQGSRFTVALCDIDHFRIYNAQHSTRVGDAALRLLAEVLCRAVRPTDLVARPDGDQFLIVLTEVSAHDALKAAERVREMLVITQATRPEPAFTVSFGLADSAHARTVEDMLRQSGDALEVAKRSGRNRVALAEWPQPGADFPQL